MPPIDGGLTRDGIDDPTPAAMQLIADAGHSLGIGHVAADVIHQVGLVLLRRKLRKLCSRCRCCWINWQRRDLHVPEDIGVVVRARNGLWLSSRGRITE